MATVTFRDASRVYPGSTHPAVDKLNLEIGDGEFMVLVGPSGCGKSTSLRMLAGLEEVSDGDIYIGDRQVTHAAPKDRDIAMVFQNYALYPHMTVADNMGFALKMAGVSKDERDRRVREAAVPSSAAHRCSAWTSRCRTSTRSCASAPARRSQGSSSGSE
jgi:multiple sugar transport system ATP-binding protein